MNDDAFSKLAEKTNAWLALNKDLDFHLDDILSGLYVDTSHFIYEILQNAEDAGATNIDFNLSENKLEITHDGRYFDFADVKGITGIGKSTKSEDLNNIGKFGVGFKSVFAVTKTPIIWSGKYHFKIENLVVPQQLSNQEINETVIELPFNHEKNKQDKVFNMINNKLQTMDLKTLLFLSNLCEIKWRTPDKKGHYRKSNVAILGVENTQKTIINSVVSEESSDVYKYLVFDKSVEIDSKNITVQVAYKLDTDEDSNEKIAPVSNQDSRLVVYFPTEKVTYLKFIIHGPFRTTPNRENIPLDDDQNKDIIRFIAELVAESIPVVKKLRLLHTDFLRLLPIVEKPWGGTSEQDEPIYSSIYGAVKAKFLSGEKLLPTNHGSYACPNESILARTDGLTKLLKKKDIQALFGKAHWLDTNITEGKELELHKYLRHTLDVYYVDFEDFARRVTSSFMETQNDNWVVKFYGELINQDSLFRDKRVWPYSDGLLRNAPIIRLEDNQHSSIFDESGKIQVYLPTQIKSAYKTVKNSIARNRKVTEFLKKHNITEPDIFDEIHQLILPKYRNGDGHSIADGFYEDMNKILSAWRTKDASEKHNALMGELRKLPFIEAVCGTTNQTTLQPSSQVYLNTDGLQAYFSGNKDVFFMSDNLYVHCTNNKFEKEEFDKFALEIGCSNVPRRIREAGSLTYKEQERLRATRGVGITGKIDDYTYDGLANIIRDINLTKSCILWKMLLASVSSYHALTRVHFFDGVYSWAYQGRQLGYFDSKFKKTLMKEKWLFDKADNLVSPRDVLITELHDDYRVDDKSVNMENARILEKALGFVLDEIRRIEEEIGGKFMTKEQIKKDKQKKKQLKEKCEHLEQHIEQLLRKTNEREQAGSSTASESVASKQPEWIPEVLPDNVTPEIVDKLPRPVSKEPGDRGSLSGNGDDEELCRAENQGDGEHVESSNKEIGIWGEQLVFKYFSSRRFINLQNREETELGFIGTNETDNTIEVRWKNKNGHIGVGYDFVIIENGVEIEYIEVKTTIKSGENWHHITGAQWKFARQLYDRGDGDKYYIYTIKNAGGQDAKIGRIINPIKQWHEGTLYAHPINFMV